VLNLPLGFKDATIPGISPVKAILRLMPGWKVPVGFNIIPRKSLIKPVKAPATGPKSRPEKITGRFPKPSRTVLSNMVKDKYLVRIILKLQRIDAITRVFVDIRLALWPREFNFSSFEEIPIKNTSFHFSKA